MPRDAGQCGAGEQFFYLRRLLTRYFCKYVAQNVDWIKANADGGHLPLFYCRISKYRCSYLLVIDYSELLPSASLNVFLRTLLKQIHGAIYSVLSTSIDHSERSLGDGGGLPRG